MAPALETLDGKNLFLVDIGFENSDNFMTQLHGWFEEHEPGIRTEVVRWRDQHNPDPELCERIAAEGDAAIIGVGTGLGCAPEVPGHMIEMESKYGIPTVAVHVHVFARLVDSTARTNGMPQARQAFVPAPMFNQPPAVWRGYVEGDDAVHGGPFMRRVLDLSPPARRTRTVAERGGTARPRGCSSRTRRRTCTKLFRENNWTDYLPIVLPKKERVEAMQAGTSLLARRGGGQAPADDRYGALGVDGGEGGGERGDGRGGAGALSGDPRLVSSGDTGRQSSMSSMGNMVVVNGPIRNEIGMNSGIGAMGPYNFANSAIGRAFGIASQNLQGGWGPGLSYGGSQGCNLSYNCCTFAENEEREPILAVPRPARPRAGGEHRRRLLRVGEGLAEHLREYWQEKLMAMMSGLELLEGALFVLDPIVRGSSARRARLQEKIASGCSTTCGSPPALLGPHHAEHDPRAGRGRRRAWAGLRRRADELIPLFEQFGVTCVRRERTALQYLPGSADARIKSITCAVR